MSYRANKIRQRLIERMRGPDFSWIGIFDASTREHHKPLDPLPFACGHPNFRGMRHVTNWCDTSTLSPRPGYEQDRSKYE